MIPGELRVWLLGAFLLGLLVGAVVAALMLRRERLTIDPQVVDRARRLRAAREGARWN